MNWWFDALIAEQAQSEIWRKQAYEAFTSGDTEALRVANRRWEASLDRCELIMREPEMVMEK